MEREVITKSQAISVISMFIIGSAIVLGAGGDARQDVWIAIIIAILMSIPVLWLYSKILTVYPGEDLFGVVEIVFGSIIGKTISLLFVWYAFHLGALVIRNFVEFINIVAIPETPGLIIALFMGILCIWVVKAGVEVLGRWAAFIFPLLLVVITCIIVISAVNIETDNIRPVLYNGLKPVLAGAYGMFAFPFAETIIFTMVFNDIREKNKVFRVFFYSLIISGSLMLLASVRNILVLGVETVLILYFPSYSAVSTINLGNFLQRIEVIISVIFLFAGFVKTSVCLFAACKGISRIFNLKNYRFFAVPIGLLMIYLSIIIYDSTMEMFDWAFKTYKFYAVPFQLILPIIIFAGAKIKARKSA